MTKLRKTRKVFEKSDFISNPVTSGSDAQENDLHRNIKGSNYNWSELPHFLFNSLSREEQEELLEKVAKNDREPKDLHWLLELFQIIFCSPLRNHLLKQIEDLEYQINLLNNQVDSLELENKVVEEANKKPPTLDEKTSTASEKVTGLSSLKKILFSFVNNQELSIEILEIFEEYPQEIESSETLKFARIFVNHWQPILPLLSETIYDELVWVKKLNQALRDFLQNIEDLKPSARKSILFWAAKQCNARLSMFEFISPEAYVKVEPAYHNVIDSSGGRIKTGLSYLIVRKQNKQVVFKADVKTY